jgi:sugar (pentulose or hexulose) kinase
MDGKVSANADAAFGASILAGVGVGVLGKLEDAICLCSNTERFFEYNRENHKIYSDLFCKYKRIKNANDKYGQ